ncbi:VOC family protein [Nocardioides sp. GY 10113]|uniref:VOC family protein n=1 Tax=Nocardioides sp. GY 10113 TaxID=2569761 RepID=UPI0010A88328|nr:VOC family protein [Nocardioides sp. GY 10113]TIC83267.1 VOC family protein [Nocardioides sp. GY 10113]
MAGPGTPSWVTAFLDHPADAWERGVDFWATVTGHPRSAARGTTGELATLVPPDGAPFLKAQRLGHGPGRIHLDLHVADPRAAADHAVTLGAIELTEDPEGFVVLSSPAGLVLCFVDHPAAGRPAPLVREGGHTALVDQVCLDVPPASYDAECAFWADLTGWERRSSSVSTDFVSLQRPEGQPLRFLLQRLAGAEDEAGAHLDWATTDRAAETEAHVALGATVEAVNPVWTVLADPVGRRYCLTDRDPATGLLPAG